MLRIVRWWNIRSLLAETAGSPGRDTSAGHMKLAYVLVFVGMISDLRIVAEIRSWSSATTCSRSDRKVCSQQVRVGMKPCPRQALNCASNATSIRHEEAAEVMKDVQDVQSNLMQDIKWKYKDVNCVDKSTWYGTPISSRRWSSSTWMVRLRRACTVARRATNLEKLTLTKISLSAAMCNGWSTRSHSWLPEHQGDWCDVQGDDARTWVDSTRSDKF